MSSTTFFFYYYVRLHVTTFLIGLVIRPCYSASQKMPCTYWDPSMFTLIKRVITSVVQMKYTWVHITVCS